MPQLKNGQPKYRLHKRSGNAYVSLNGEDYYLGKHDSKASWREYDRLIAEWLANGRQIPSDKRRPDALSVAELIAKFWDFVKSNYVKNGEPTSERHAYRAALRFVKNAYDATLVQNFGPLALKAVREKMVESGLARSCVNNYVNRIKRMFSWGVENEQVPIVVYQALKCIGGLRKGKTEAHETEPVKPVADAVVEQTLPFLSSIVADMVRVQRLTGCRPQDVCGTRPYDVDTSGEVWVYRPESHKTEHHGCERMICIGPKAQVILTPYLEREAEAYCFSPLEAEQRRRAERHQNRRTPLAYGNSPGSNRKISPARAAGEKYTTDSYRRAIHRACEQAFPPPPGLPKDERDAWRLAHQWSPNQLRHTAATEIRKKFGLEAAQILLGHSKCDVTQIYAERDMERAMEIVGRVG